MIQTTNQTKLFGILGTPIAHTLSPTMHSYMAEKTGVDMAYLAFDVLPEQLDNTMRGIKAMGAAGMNITAPHKIHVMQHIDVVDEDAIRMDSVNTIVNKSGVWHGYNTDGDGFCGSLMLEGRDIRDKHILMIGAGGSARSLCYKLAKHGAKSISITSRNEENIHIIGDMVEKYTDALFFDGVDMNRDYDIVINTTPVGMHPYENANPCNFMGKISEGVCCCDIIYNPRKTVFLKEAQLRGAHIMNGLGMLVLQGILAFEHFNHVQLNHAEYYDELMSLFRQYRI